MRAFNCDRRCCSPVRRMLSMAASTSSCDGPRILVEHRLGQQTLVRFLQARVDFFETQPAARLIESEYRLKDAPRRKSADGLHRPQFPDDLAPHLRLRQQRVQQHAFVVAQRHLGAFQSLLPPLRHGFAKTVQHHPALHAE